MDKIKIGIIGCGYIANEKHLPSISYFKDTEVVGFCDIVREKAEISAKRFGTPEAYVCTDYRELLAREEIDVIHVCTPNSSHSEITVAALNSDKHVMCEKPMAKTVSEAKDMLDASTRTGKLLTIGYQNRFREDSLLLKSLCENGELGEIYLGKAFATRRRGVPTWGVFMDREKQGGGPLIDIGTHALDLTLWMMQNYEPISVLGSTNNKLGKLGSSANIMGPWNPANYEVEDCAFGLINFKNGATVILEASWAINMIIANEAMTMLCGTKGGADMFPPNGPVVRTTDFQNPSSYHVRFNGERYGNLFVKNYTANPSFMGNGSKAESFAGGRKEMDIWFKAIRGEGELVVRPEEAYMVTRILEAIYKSAASGKSIYFE